MLRPYNTACRWLYLCVASGNAFTCFSSFLMFLLNFTFGYFWHFLPISLASAIGMCILYAISAMMAQQWFLGHRVQWAGWRGFLGTSERRCRPNKKKSFSYLLTSQPARPRFMKEKSVKVPALKDLLDRPLDLGNVELMERAIKDAGVAHANWSSPWGNSLRSLKPHGSSPERVLDLLCFLGESSDEKMRQTDLDDVTLEHLTAARSALREVIRDGELALWQVAWWLVYLDLKNSWCLGSEALRLLRAMDARASILMTRLKDEAVKENARCLQEVASSQIGILFLTPRKRTTQI